LIPRKPSKEPLEKWDLKPGKYILAVARLVRHKGIHYLIEAYKNLYNKEFLIRQDGFGMTNKIALAMTNGGAKLVIVGAPSFTDDYLDYLKEVAAEDPNVIFTGFQRGATLSALFANAYLYVHPSEAEGLAITILEAMSHGRCVLTSDISENAEAIDDCGVLFKSGDVEDLKDKMVALIKNPKRVKSLGVKAKTLIEKNYEWGSVADGVELVYKRAGAQ
jgi:glycosyltransferase involved in cell wall biosynthesis